MITGCAAWFGDGCLTTAAAKALFALGEHGLNVIADIFVDNPSVSARQSR
jgi:hypothetical protein